MSLTVGRWWPRLGHGVQPAQDRRGYERRPLARALGEPIEDHEEHGGVVQQAGVAAAHLDVLALVADSLDAAAPVDDPVGS